MYGIELLLSNLYYITFSSLAAATAFEKVERKYNFQMCWWWQEEKHPSQWEKSNISIVLDFSCIYIKVEKLYDVHYCNNDRPDYHEERKKTIHVMYGIVLVLYSWYGEVLFSQLQFLYSRGGSTGFFLYSKWQIGTPPNESCWRKQFMVS